MCSSDLKAKGLDYETISDITGLSIQEIEKLGIDDTARFQMDGPDSISRRNKQFLIPTVYPQIYGLELHARRGGMLTLILAAH